MILEIHADEIDVVFKKLHDHFVVPIIPTFQNLLIIRGFFVTGFENLHVVHVQDASLRTEPPVSDLLYIAPFNLSFVSVP